MDIVDIDSMIFYAGIDNEICQRWPIIKVKYDRYYSFIVGCNENGKAVVSLIMYRNTDNIGYVTPPMRKLITKARHYLTLRSHQDRNDIRFLNTITITRQRAKHYELD